MSGNTESTSKSIKFAPMPMATLLANLMPLHNQTSTPDLSYTSADEDESDDSIAETVANKPSPNKSSKKNFLTPVVKNQAKETLFISEKKPNYQESNKENRDWSSNQTHPSKDRRIHKNVNKEISYPGTDIKKRNILIPHISNTKNINLSLKKTPEMVKLRNSGQKTKPLTPIVKPGIRKFTPGSAHKSQKKTPQKANSQNRDRIRCELFAQNQSKDEQCTPALQQSANNPSIPETPMNKKPIPATYAATPSYPQGVSGNNSKVLFKTTIIKDKKYMFIKKLGTGGSSEVYKMLEIGTSCEYAVKCVSLATDQELAQGYVNEVRLLRELQNSDRVIRLFDYEYDRSNRFLRIVLEVGETDLSSFLKARKTRLPPALVVHYWEEMLHAVHFIHENGVIHADLKPANFLLVCGQLKLIDFGIASAISSDATSVVRAQATGTYSYISPEALMGGAGGYGPSTTDSTTPIKISFRSDVWSLGCILYSMVYGRTPFGHIANFAKLTAILDPNHKIDYPPIEHLPPSLIAAMKWCLTYNVRARPWVRELLAINYIQPSSTPLPAALLDILRSLVTPQEFASLERAHI